MKFLPYLYPAFVLSTFASALPLPETPAPLFRTTAVVPEKNNPAGKVVDNFALASLIGKKRIMLLSYPKNCTFICPTELLAIKKKMKEFRKLGYEVLVLSSDEAAYSKDAESSHQAWRMKPENADKGSKNSPIGIGDANFVMLSDPNRQIIRQYGIQSSNGLALRATFFIGLDGDIYIADVQNNSIGRDVDELLRKAAAVKYIEEHRDKVTPEGWHPDDPGMSPTHEGVRKQLTGKSS